MMKDQARLEIEVATHTVLKAQKPEHVVEVCAALMEAIEQVEDALDEKGETCSFADVLVAMAICAVHQIRGSVDTDYDRYIMIGAIGAILARGMACPEGYLNGDHADA